MSPLFHTQQTDQFIRDGFIRLDNMFTAKLAEKARNILWNDLPADRNNPQTWTEPVIRLGMYTQKPFVQSVNSFRLYAVFDQLIGKDKWLPCCSVGVFPVRFPSAKQPDDTGKHVDASFPGGDSYAGWRVNIKSKGRALLMLVLYSEVSENDAPTVIYKGSHLDVARLLQPEGDAGLSFTELAAKLDDLPGREQVYATGGPGTIYLCHPFMVHAAQAHKGHTPKFMAQPPLLLPNELTIDDSDTGYAPVEQAIRLALNETV